MQKENRRHAAIATCMGIIAVSMMLVLIVGVAFLPEFLCAGHERIMLVRIAGSVSTQTGWSLPSVLRAFVLGPAIAAALLVGALGGSLRIDIRQRECDRSDPSG